MGHEEEGVRLKRECFLFQNHEILDCRIAGTAKFRISYLVYGLPACSLIQAMLQQDLEDFVIGNAKPITKEGPVKAMRYGPRRGDFLVILIPHPPAVGAQPFAVEVNRR